MEYSKEFQTEASLEAQSIKAPRIKAMLDDYLVLRDMVRECE